MKQKITKVAQTATTFLGSMYLASQLAVVRAQNITNAIANQKGYANDFGALINFVLRVVMIIAALLVFLYLIMGGIEYITSGGEKGKTEAARNKITAAIVGLVILAASYAILTLVLRFLGLGDLTTAINNVGTINNP